MVSERCWFFSLVLFSHPPEHDSKSFDVQVCVTWPEYQAESSFFKACCNVTWCMVHDPAFTCILKTDCDLHCVLSFEKCSKKIFLNGRVNQILRQIQSFS